MEFVRPVREAGLAEPAARPFCHSSMRFFWGTSAAPPRWRKRISPKPLKRNRTRYEAERVNYERKNGKRFNEGYCPLPRVFTVGPERGGDAERPFQSWAVCSVVGAYGIVGAD